jgi:hypothetical protein
MSIKMVARIAKEFRFRNKSATKNFDDPRRARA